MIFPIEVILSIHIDKRLFKMGNMVFYSRWHRNIPVISFQLHQKTNTIFPNAFPNKIFLNNPLRKLPILSTISQEYPFNMLFSNTIFQYKFISDLSSTFPTSMTMNGNIPIVFRISFDKTSVVIFPLKVDRYGWNVFETW